MFHILSKVVKGFLSCESQKWGFPTDWQQPLQKVRTTVLPVMMQTTAKVTRCSAIAARPRCRVRYSFRQK